MILNCHQTSVGAVRLWMSGNHLLTYKIANGGVTHISLENYDSIQPRWPTFLKQLKQLEELAINTYSAFPDSVDCIRSELRQLSSHLRVLHLSIVGGPTILFGLPSQATASAPEDDTDRPSKRPKRVEAADADHPHQSLWNLDITWPKLQRLEVAELAPGFEPPIASRIFALLPRSLLDFRLDALMERPACHVDTLPPNLERLNVPTCIDAEGLRQLPSSIIDVGCCLEENSILALLKDPCLLPNLKDFPCPDRVPAALDWILESEDGKWPDAINTLDFLDRRAERIFGRGRLLPRQLKFLTIVDSESSYDLSAEWLTKSFPPGLIQLTLDVIKWDGIEFSMWPSTLVTLHVGNGSIGPQHFHKLPRSLTYLNTGPGTDLDDEEDDGFEIDTSLALGRSLIEGADKERWQRCKAELTKNLYNLAWTVTIAVAGYIVAVDCGRLLGLPLDLEHFSYGGHDHANEYTMVLPPRLGSVTLPGVMAAQPRFLELLSPSITDLTTSFPQYETNDAVADPASTALYNLPFLHSLAIISDSKAASLALLCLPRHLTSLRLNATNSRVPTFLLTHLPSGLTTLDITAKCSTPSSAEPWVERLPRSLRYFSSTHLLAGADFCKLPPLLKKLRTCLKDVKLEDFGTLPQSLTIFERHPSKRTGYVNLQRTSGFLSDTDLDFLVTRYGGFLSMLHDSSLEEATKALQTDIATRRKHYNFWEMEDSDYVSENED